MVCTALDADVDEAGSAKPRGGVEGGGHAIDRGIETGRQWLVIGYRCKDESTPGPQGSSDVAKAGAGIGPEVKVVHAEHLVKAVVGNRQGYSIAVIKRDQAGCNGFRVVMGRDCDHGRRHLDAAHLRAGGGEQPKGSAGAKADLANPLARAGREQLDGDAIDVGGLGSPDPSQ